MRRFARVVATGSTTMRSIYKGQESKNMKMAGRIDETISHLTT